MDHALFQAGILSEQLIGLLVAIDVAIAVAIKAEGCPHCRSALHAGHYKRKPRGHGVLLDPRMTMRLSWCCRKRGCRGRVTPPSVRFWGQLVYTGAIVLAMLCVPPATAEEAQLRRDSGCSRQSVKRWRGRFISLWTTDVGQTLVRSVPLAPHEQRHMRTLLSRWAHRWPLLVATWHMLIHPLTGGRRWRHDGQRYGPLNTQKLGLAPLLEALQTPACAL